MAVSNSVVHACRRAASSSVSDDAVHALDAVCPCRSDFVTAADATSGLEDWALEVGRSAGPVALLQAQSHYGMCAIHALPHVSIASLSREAVVVAVEPDAYESAAVHV